MRAKLAGIDVGQIVANRTTTNGPFHFEDGFGELGRIRLIHFQDKEGKPLSGLRADSRKFLELVDEPADRFCDIHLSEQTWNLQSTGQIPKLALHRLVDFA